MTISLSRKAAGPATKTA